MLRGAILMSKTPLRSHYRLALVHQVNLLLIMENPQSDFLKQLFEDEEGSYSEKVEEMCEFSFEQDSGITKELFLIFLKQQNQTSYKVFSLPLSQDKFEYGSFVCYSQYKEALYLAYGNQKQVLGAGKSVKFKHNEEK